MAEQIWGTEPTGLTITSFTGVYNFLHNDFNVPIVFDDYTFKNATAAYYACKDPDNVELYIHFNATAARTLGKQIMPPPDWNEDRVQVMYDVLCLKFKDNGFMRHLLAKTTPAIIAPTLGDEFWGFEEGKGKNMLGLLLMRIREENLTEQLKTD